MRFVRDKCQLEVADDAVDHGIVCEKGNDTHLLYLCGTEFAKAQFDTIRCKLIKIGARVRQMSTRIKVHLPSSFPLKEELEKIWYSFCRAGPA